MTAAAFALVKTIRVGTQFAVTFSIPAGDPGEEVATFVEWSPPRDRDLTSAELADFHRGRAAVLRELSRRTGQAVRRLP